MKRIRPGSEGGRRGPALATGVPPAPRFPAPHGSHSPNGSHAHRRASVWARRAVQAFLTIAVTWLIMDRVGVTLDEALSLEGAVPAPAPAWIALSVGALLCGFVLSAVLWGRMAGELGGRPPGAVSAIRIVMTANLGRYLPGKLWQMAGLAMLSRREGMSATVGATAGVLGQVFSLAAAGVVALPALSATTAEVERGGVVALFSLALFLLVVSVPPFFHGTLALAFRLARIPREHIPPTGVSFGPRWFLWYLLNWAVYGIAFVLFARGLGFTGGVVQLAAPFAAAYLLGYIAIFAPAGIGVREGFLIAFLHPVVGPAAVGIALLTRVWMTSVELLPAGAMAVWIVQRGGGDRVEAPAEGPEEGGGGGDGPKR